MVMGTFIETFSSVALLRGWSVVAAASQTRAEAAIKTRVLLAITGLVLLGILLAAMIMIVWVGSRMIRRYVVRSSDRATRRSGGSLDDDAWARRPLVPPFEEDPDEPPSEEDPDEPPDSFSEQ